MQHPVADRVSRRLVPVVQGGDVGESNPYVEEIVQYRALEDVNAGAGAGVFHLIRRRTGYDRPALPHSWLTPSLFNQLLVLVAVATAPRPGSRRRTPGRSSFFHLASASGHRQRSNPARPPAGHETNTKYGPYDALNKPLPVPVPHRAPSPLMAGRVTRRNIGALIAGQASVRGVLMERPRARSKVVRYIGFGQRLDGGRAVTGLVVIRG